MFRTTNAARRNSSPTGPSSSASPASTARSRRKGLVEALDRHPRGLSKSVQPAALTLSQVTEAGTLYSLAEIAALAAIAHQTGVAVHMDGARFANALVSLGASPADMSWRAGVDVLSFGATKNGAFACEAVVFFDSARAQTFPYLRKRGGHTVSKGRWLGAQMGAYLEDGLWLDLARPRQRRGRAALARPGRDAGRAAGLADAGQRGVRGGGVRARGGLERRRRGVLSVGHAQRSPRHRRASRRDHAAAGNLI